MIPCRQKLLVAFNNSSTTDGSGLSKVRKGFAKDHFGTEVSQSG